MTNDAMSKPPARKCVKKARAVSQSKKSGLHFPVGRIARQLKNGRFAPRLGAAAPVFLAAVLEYLVAEVVELAGDAANKHKKKRITPRFINLAIREDLELDALLQRVTIAEGGVLPLINHALLKKQKQGLSVSDQAVKAALNSATTLPVHVTLPALDG